MHAAAFPHIAARHRAEVNCCAKVYADVESLEAGHPVGHDSEGLLVQSKGHLVSPRRDWQQSAAVEGLYGGMVKILSCKALDRATRVVITDHPMAGTYEVLSVQTSKQTGAGERMWRLELSRRKVAP